MADAPARPKPVTYEAPVGGAWFAAVFDDLEMEMATACAAMPVSAFRQVLALGADQRFAARLHGAGDLGAARVSLSRDGASWEPEGEAPRLLLAVREWGELLDVVALSSGCRDEWALRTGDGWALGIDRLHDVEHARDLAIAEERRVRAKLRLFANPFDWLAAGGDGLCVLEWGTMALCSLRSLGEGVTLVVEPQAKEKLRALLAWGGLPRVESTLAATRRAA